MKNSGVVEASIQYVAEAGVLIGSSALSFVQLCYTVGRMKLTSLLRLRCACRMPRREM